MRKRYIISNIFFLIRITRLFIIAYILLNILSGIIPLLSIVITKNLVNSVLELSNSKSQDLSNFIFWIMMEVLALILIPAISLVDKFLYGKIRIKLNYIVQKQIYNKIIEITYSNFEDPKFHDHLNRVKDGDVADKILSPFQNLLSMISVLITIFSVSIYLLSVHWALIITVSTAAIPMLIFTIKYAKGIFELVYSQTPMLRENSYINYLFTQKQSIKEIKLFRIGDYLEEKWSELYLKISNKELNMQIKLENIHIIIQTLTSIAYAISLFIVVYLIRVQRLTVGDFVAIGQAIITTQNNINQFSGSIGKLYEQNLFLKDLYEFLEYEDKYISEKQDKVFPIPIQEGIQFNKLSYKYPNAKNYSLKDVELMIRTGEKVAIVGENGSGKSTLIKCLLGLYTPTKGTIEIDGNPINEINTEEMYKNLSVIFQDFVKYNFSVKENIIYGNIDERDNEEKLLNVLKSTNMDQKITSFQEGYETRLGKFIFEGEELSEGQWQRLAISRVLFGESQILVFDEPTAALDPYAEIEIFNMIRRISKDKTVFFVSHRMASASMADKVMVMKEGKVSEFGSHDELMKRQGLYYEMYEIQSNWSQREREVSLHG